MADNNIVQINYLKTLFTSTLKVSIDYIFFFYLKTGCLKEKHKQRQKKIRFAIVRCCLDLLT